MKISDKLYRKYASRSPLLPPEGEEVVVNIPKHNKLPSIKPLSEEEMEQWDEFVANKKFEKELENDLDISKKINDLGKEEKLEQDLGTIPAIPSKKQGSLSPDTLLKMCSKYHDLCCKP